MNAEEAIAKYYSLLAKWNERISLVSSARDETEFRAKHVEDALALIPFLSGARTLLDIGTGAGIPGIIIKIARPDIDVTLLDSTRKKVGFCEEAIRQLGLTGIRAICGRAEDARVQGMLGRFDAIVSRATWQIEEYLNISYSYIAETEGSRVLAMKGPAWRDELDAAKASMERLGLKLLASHEYRLRTGESRAILSIGRKDAST
ncbi:MAG: 16S rRNA (guanine(527)-N(7))-methyltransferase RsmG [bacterium]